MIPAFALGVPLSKTSMRYRRYRQHILHATSRICQIPTFTHFNTRDLHVAVFAAVATSQPSSDPVLEGDLIVYRPGDASMWKIGAVVEVAGPNRYEVRPVHAREAPQEGSIECFVEWDSDELSVLVSTDVHEIVLIDADYEERVVQDRSENPHGEMSEDCWRVATQTLENFQVSIPNHFIS